MRGRERNARYCLELKSHSLGREPTLRSFDEFRSCYRYSNKIVYNNFPWPRDVTDAQRQAIEVAAQAILDARQQHRGATLADLYDRLTMPAELQDAHAANDRAVERCYRRTPFRSESERIEFLFRLYAEYAAPLAPAGGPRRRRRT